MVLDKGLITYAASRPVVVLDRENRFVFFANRKAGIHSVCRHLLKDRAVIHKDFPYDWQAMLWPAMKSLDRLFTFTIVRNPFDRTVSAFHALQQYSGKWPGMRFKEFITAEFSKRGEKVNHHFASQHPTFCYRGRPFVKFIARLENIVEDWRTIAREIGCPKVLPHRNKSERKNYTQYYDDETKRIVERIYRKDLDVLGYEYGD